MVGEDPVEGAFDAHGEAAGRAGIILGFGFSGAIYLQFVVAADVVG